MSYTPEATPLRKLPQIWILALVTYGLVLAVTIAAVFVYKHYWPNANAVELELERRSTRISVGDIWIPVYPDAIHQGMTSSIHDGLIEGDLRFTSSDAPAKLIAFYRDRLKAAFEVTYTPTERGGRIEAVANRGKSVATLTFTASGSGCDSQVHTQAVQTSP